MIEFHVHGKWSPRAVACRVALLIGTGAKLNWGTSAVDDPTHPPWWQDDKFQLNGGNDWWLRPMYPESDDEPPRYRLSYRYETEDRAAAIEGLKPYLEWVFGKEDADRQLWKAVHLEFMDLFKSGAEA